MRRMLLKREVFIKKFVWGEKNSKKSLDKKGKRVYNSIEAQ